MKSGKISWLLDPRKGKKGGASLRKKRLSTLKGRKKPLQPKYSGRAGARHRVSAQGEKEREKAL